MQAGDIMTLLPSVFQAQSRGGEPVGALAGLLEGMSAMHEGPEAVLGDLSAWFAFERAPARMLPYLAQWVDLDWLVHLDVDGPVADLPGGAERLRILLRAASDLSARRGTAGGLRDFLALALQTTECTVQETGPFHVTITLPAEASAHRDVVERIVSRTKPVHVKHEVVFTGQES